MALSHHLTNYQTYITGTLRKDRVGNPKDLIEMKLNKGDATWAGNGNVTVCKWKDKRDVYTISNAHVPAMVDVANRNKKITKKPNLVRDYNLRMGGVDRSDQMLSYHSALKKTVRWNKKVGVHLIEMLVHNAHYLFNKSKSKKDRMGVLEFKERVIEWLIGEIATPKYLTPAAEFHYLHPMPEGYQGMKKKRPSKNCTFCSTPGNRHETRYVCGFCRNQPALCIHPCFVLYHQGIGVAIN